MKVNIDNVREIGLKKIGSKMYSSRKCALKFIKSKKKKKLLIQSVAVAAFYLNYMHLMLRLWNLRRNNIKMS